MVDAGKHPRLVGQASLGERGAHGVFGAIYAGVFLGVDTEDGRFGTSEIRVCGPRAIEWCGCGKAGLAGGE